MRPPAGPQVQGPYSPFQGEAFPQVLDAARTGMYGVMVVPAPPEEQQESRGDAGRPLLLVGSYDVRKHPGGKQIRWEQWLPYKIHTSQARCV